MFFFFFSSRRRHTRFSRDWSSDVCSSDLRGTQVSVTARVSSGQTPVAGTSVSFRVIRSDGKALTATATTDATGTAVWRFRLKARDPVGQWQVQATAGFQGTTGSA